MEEACIAQHNNNQRESSYPSLLPAVNRNMQTVNNNNCLHHINTKRGILEKPHLNFKCRSEIKEKLFLKNFNYQITKCIINWSAIHYFISTKSPNENHPGFVSVGCFFKIFDD
jgi:hypothetical protein